MTKPLIAVITDKPKDTQQSRMFFWVKEAIAADTNTPIVFTTPLERTTISSLTTKVASELDKNPLDSADYRAMLLKKDIMGETAKQKDATNTAEADLTVADLFDATNEKVIEIANNKIEEYKKTSEGAEESCNIQTAAEALAGIDGYMVAGGKQCGQDNPGQPPATCWIRYNFKESLVYMKKPKDEGKSIQDGLPVEDEGNTNNVGAKANESEKLDTTPFSYASHSDGTVTVSNFKFGKEIGSTKTIGFDVLTVETVKLKSNDKLVVNPKYKTKRDDVVLSSTAANAEMYIVKVHRSEERFDWSDEAVRAGTWTIGEGESAKTETCGSDVRCEDAATFTGKDADPQIFKGEKFEIVMRTSGDYYAIAKNDPTEEFYYSGNMGPFAKKRDHRRGTYTKTGSEDKGFTYTFYGEDSVPVFKIVDCSKGENTNTETTAASTENASNSGDNNKSCSSGYRAAGHIALANYDSFVFFNIDAADEIQKAWESKSE